MHTPEGPRRRIRLTARRRTACAVAGAALVVALAGCSGGDANDAAVAASPDTSATASAAGTASASPTPADAFLTGMPAISQTTPVSGGGTRPALAWETVDGADHYGVYVYTPDGRPYWSWRGRTTTAYVGGGGEPLNEDAAGPSITEGMTWVVIAYDADLAPVASSPQRPIAP